MRLSSSTVLLLFFVAAGWLGSVAAAGDPLSAWPAGKSPMEIGLRLARNWRDHPLGLDRGVRQNIMYQEACTWFGAIKVTALARDDALRRELTAKFDRFLTAPGTAHLHLDTAHVGYRVLGIVPLALFRHTGDPRHLEIGRRFADAQWADPAADGLTREARFWVDDIYMIVALQTQAYRATREPRYLDRAALATAAYVERLQQPDGLFHHAPDSPFNWARGNGWQAAAFVELLRVLPEDHPRHGAIMRGFRTMMSSLAKWQTAEGLWRQLVDRPDSWVETSGSAMFAYAFVAGVKRGWLDGRAYGPRARKAWLALADHLDENANLREVCIGTNKAHDVAGPDPAAQLKFYLERPRHTGDLHGQAAMLWLAAAGAHPIDGVSLAPLLRGKRPPNARTLFWHLPH